MVNIIPIIRLRIVRGGGSNALLSVVRLFHTVVIGVHSEVIEKSSVSIINNYEDNDLL